MAAPTLDRVLDAVFRVDVDFQIKFISDPGLRWLGNPQTPAVPRSLFDLLSPDDVERVKTESRGTPETFSCDVEVHKPEGICWVNLRCYLLPTAQQYVVCIIDISRWKVGDTALRHAAQHDDLTGLPNRALLKQTVDALIKEGATQFSIALLDLDGFKKVNDTYGHLIGDAVLIETAKRLTKAIGPQGVVGRLGGDEFVVVLPLMSAAAAKALATGILLAIARPYDTAPHNAYLGVSIGIAEYPEQGNLYPVLLKNADTAMYHAKSAGKNQISFYAPTESSADFSIKAAIHNGIQEGEFFLEFQPQFDMRRRVIGAEALMRWNSRDFGRVSPDKFIPVAEEAGLIGFLGKWALRYSCHQLKKIHALLPDFVMSVNVSPVQFSAEDFDVMVIDAIQSAAVDPACVVLEITESTLMRSQERTERALGKLREHGVRFSIGDFGTGFSSLAYLTRLPVSSIKIDKAFVRAIEHEHRATATDKKLITAMVNLAHSIDLKVVAEGVETEAQFAFLKESDCNLIQGYLLGRPMSAGALMELLSHQTKAVA